MKLAEARSMPRLHDTHNGPNYKRLARLIRRHANANPATACWYCGRTLAEHPPHKNGRPAFWTAGHLIPGQPDHELTLGSLVAEASVCNFVHDNNRGQAVEPHSPRWNG